MNILARIFNRWEQRGVKNRPITDEDVLRNAKPITSAILEISPCRPVREVREAEETIAASDS